MKPGPGAITLMVAAGRAGVRFNVALAAVQSGQILAFRSAGLWWVSTGVLPLLRKLAEGVGHKEVLTNGKA